MMKGLTVEILEEAKEGWKEDIDQLKGAAYQYVQWVAKIKEEELSLKTKVYIFWNHTAIANITTVTFEYRLLWNTVVTSYQLN